MHLQKECEEYLVGKWFHSIKSDGSIGLQGQIIGIQGKFARIQLYSWLSGDPTDEETVRIAELIKWRLYPSSEEMNMYYHLRSELDSINPSEY